MTDYNVFGPSSYYGSPTHSNAGEPIELGNGFVSTSAGACKGARLWVPVASIPDLETTFRLRAYATPDFSTSPLAEVAAAPLGVGGWTSAEWDEPIDMGASDPIWLTYQFGVTQRFISSGDGPPGAVLSADFPDLALLAPGDGRSYFRASGGATTLASGGPMYGLDIIFDDGTPPKAPIAITATRLTGITALVEGDMPEDAPAGLTVLRAPGLVTVDGEGRAFGVPGYDPETIVGAAIIETGVELPYLDTDGLDEGDDYTYFVVRTGEGA